MIKGSSPPPNQVLYSWKGKEVERCILTPEEQEMFGSGLLGLMMYLDQVPLILAIEMSDGKPVTMSDAMEKLKASGYLEPNEIRGAASRALEMLVDFGVLEPGWSSNPKDPKICSRIYTPRKEAVEYLKQLKNEIRKTWDDDGFERSVEKSRKILLFKYGKQNRDA